MHKHRTFSSLLTALLPIVLIGLIALPGFPRPANRMSTDGQEQEPTHGFDVANLDRTCKPCEDFFKFADGGWKASHPIPPAYPAWGSLSALAEKNNDKLRGILEAASKAPHATPGSNSKKIGDFYYSGMDESQIENQGVKPLEGEFHRIENIKSARDLTAEIAHLQGLGAGAPFRFSSASDFKDSSMQIATAFQGGLGLPDRDYYLKDDDHSVQLRHQYAEHVAKMFELLG
ncbi:MAG TPA: M13 family metallopeptidase N-terminal domain-containing protein, partial [Blastocatellia bacterium]|nr:M13 family metallopeptidase N-terminal domain-containing protein [Blastocatellia bacterium]